MSDLTKRIVPNNTSWFWLKRKSEMQRIENDADKDYELKDTEKKPLKYKTKLLD